MIKRSIPWISIILFAILASSASSQAIYQATSSQINEPYTLELYDYFNTVRSDITVVTESKYVSISSGVSLVSQAIVSKQDNLQALVSSDQLQVSSSTSVRIEVSTSDYLNYLFKYLLITLQADNSIQVTTTSTATLTLQTAGTIDGLSFSTSTAGYFSVSTPTDYDVNYIGSFTYSDANGLAVSIISIDDQLKSIKPYYFEGTQYLIFTAGSSLGLATPAQTGKGYQLSSLASTKDSSCLTSSFILSPMYPLLICQTPQLNYKISTFYYVNNKFTQIDNAPSAFSTKITTTIISSQSLNGIIYLLSSDATNSNLLYVSQVLLNQSTQELSIQTFSVIVPSGYLDQNLPMYIQADNLLVCFTDTSVLGYNFINGGLLFERTTYSVLNFELLNILNFGATYQLVYQSTSDTTSTTAIQYFLSIPAFTYMLTSEITQEYYLSPSSNRLTFSVDSLYLPSMKITDECTFFKDNVMALNGMIDVSSQDGTIRYNIEQAISCSNLDLGSPTIGKNDEFYELMWSIKSISSIANSIPMNNLPTTDYEIYPTQGSQFLVVAGMVTSLTEVSTENNNSFSLEIVCSESFLGAPLQTDINGFYSYQGSSLTQQIAMPFQQPGTKQNNCNLPTITTACAKKDSGTSQTIPFLFASDPLQAKVFSLCSSALTIYSYGLSSFSSTAAPTQISFTFTAQPTQAIAIAGKLFISDSKTYIVIYHYNLPQGYSETISIPQTLGTIQSLILFSESYLLRVTDASSATIAYVLPYSNNASPLRTLQYFGYTPDFSTAVPIYQTLQLPTIINEAQRLPQMQEYYILPAINATSIQSILVFRINHMTSQNQLQKIIDLKGTLKNNKIFSSTAGYLGFVDSSNNGYLYTLNYMMVLQFDVEVENPTKAFTIQPYFMFGADFRINPTNYFFPSIFFFKDVSSANAVIDSTNTQVSSLMGYFSKFDSLSQTETTSVNLTDSVSSNVLGWLPSQKGLNPPVTILLSNRVDVTLQDPQIIGLFDVLYSLPNITIISYNSTVEINKNPIEMLYPNPYLFYNPTTMKNSTVTDNNGNLISTTISASIYSIASDYKKLEQSLLTVQLTATYKPSLQTPSLQIASSIVSRNAPELNSDETITKIQSDPILGLFMLKKTKQSFTQTICLLQVTDQSFTVDCDSLSFINSIGILDVIWIPSKQLNVFISTNSILYTGFQLTGGSHAFGLDLLTKTGFGQFSSDFKTLALGGSIRRDTILISYDQVTAVELSITTSSIGGSFDVDTLRVYLGESPLQLTGQGTALSDTETLLLAMDVSNNVAYELIYSKYSTSGNSNYFSYYNIIRSTGVQSVKDITVFNGQAKISPLINSSSESLQILFIPVPGENPLGIVLSVSPLITISMAQTNSNSNYDGVGAYLQLEGTTMNQSHSIPLNIALGSSNHRTSGINLEFTLLWVLILLILQ